MAAEANSRLLAMPRELRDEILFQLMYPGEGTVLVTVLKPQRLVRSSKGLGLQVLRINKQLNLEGSQTFQRILTQIPRFVLDLELYQAMEFLSKLPEDTVRSIRSLWIPEGLAKSLQESSSLLDWRKHLFDRIIEKGNYVQVPARSRPPANFHELLLDFLPVKMQLDSIYLSTNRWRRGWPTTDVLFSLAKLLHDGIIQKVCLFSEDDSSCRNRLPQSSNYNESQRPLHDDPFSDNAPTPLQWDVTYQPDHRNPSVIASSRSTPPFVMTQEGKDPISYGIENLFYIGYGGILDTKPFKYPESCGCMYTYRKNPATITKT